MIELEKFPSHLETLQSRDWDRLFTLLPEIEITADFGEAKGGEELSDGSITMPFGASFEIVDKTFDAINELNLCPEFDWLDWQAGRSLLKNPKFDYSQLDTLTLCKLLTVIIRTDRFNDGYLVANFKNGIMTRIIKAIMCQIQRPIDIDN